MKDEWWCGSVAVLAYPEGEHCRQHLPCIRQQGNFIKSRSLDQDIYFPTTLMSDASPFLGMNVFQLFDKCHDKQYVLADSERRQSAVLLRIATNRSSHTEPDRLLQCGDFCTL